MKLILLLLFWPWLCFGQILSFGARSLALSGQEVLVNESGGSTFFNPALLLQAAPLSLWVNYYRPFNLDELKFQAFALNYTQNPFALGVGVLGFGNKVYQEQFIAASGSVSISAYFSTGLKLKIRKLSIQNYGSAQQWSMDVGVRIPVNKNAIIGVLVKNIFATPLGRSKEKPLRQVLTALKLQLHAGTAFYLETAQQPFFAPVLRAAIEVYPISALPLRIGTGLNTPELFSAGFGIYLSHFQFDYALQTHPALQQTHVFSVTIEVFQ